MSAARPPEGAHAEARLREGSSRRTPQRSWLARAATCHRVIAIAALAAGLSACSSLPGSARDAAPGMELDLGYYWQSVSGHLSLLRAARPVDDWLADPATPAALQERLALSRRMRDFAVQDLALPDNASYRRYADLGRPAVVWNVVAAPADSLTLKTWCFPVLGCVGYRGYFDQKAADALGAQLRTQGWDVSVYGVPAYSTLGKLPGSWFADPLLNTFIRGSEGELAKLIFHELAHQVAYADDDTTFNESFATAVERLGVRRWLAAHGTEASRADYARIEARRADFQDLTLRYRGLLEAAYRDAPKDATPAQRITRKAELLERLRADYAEMKATRWNGYSGYDRWFAEANNASLGVLAAYTARVGDFERLFASQGENFPAFYSEVRRLVALPKVQRNAALDEQRR